jgi:hypothetical protein
MRDRNRSREGWAAAWRSVMYACLIWYGVPLLIAAFLLGFALGAWWQAP